ncbi:MAG TPA: ATP-dependent helicase HrpB [Kofleriaceae bacterium]|nr:ATP-dependent helicase HrpB [Kofleriaceae bacterium]
MIVGELGQRWRGERLRHRSTVVRLARVKLAPLPIDDVTADVVRALDERGVCVLVAPPGAGKTTRIPGAVLSPAGDVVVLEPRRLAARMAAARVAHERGASLGGEIGYEVRFDRRVSRDTRIRFVTEGILTRRLLDDPSLRGTSIVVVDEFHERHLAADLALAAVARLRRGARKDLKIVVMSATLEAEPVARFLDAPIVVSEGRTFPVSIEYIDQPDDRPLGKQISAAVRALVAQQLDGDVLVFLPGAAEIRRAEEDLAEIAARADLVVVPLHGDLPAEDQDRAIARAPGGKRKIILSTNVAETSVTIDGVVAVIDSGLARVARHSPWSGLPALQIEPISRASAAQRAGRAGRTRPGRALRLYTKHDHDTRRAHDPPEVVRADLAEAALELHAAGVDPRAADAWFEAPPPAALDAAEDLLARLGAIDPRGALTPIGRRMLRFPAHPRQARILVEAERRGVSSEGAIIAAALGAREIRLERRMSREGRSAAKLASTSDLIDDLDAILHMREYGTRGLDAAAAHQVDRAARQLAKLARDEAPAPKTADATDDALELAILTGYPDRVGKRRAARSHEIIMAGGGSAQLSPTSSVIDAELLVAVDAGETGERGRAGKTMIRRASRIDPSWLLDLYLDRVRDEDELIWNRDKQRVERRTRLVYDGLAIDEQTDVEGARRAGEAASAVLSREAIAAGIDRFVDAEAFKEWRARVTFAAAHISGLEPPSDDQLAAQLARACDGLISFDELRKANPLALLDASLADKRALLERIAPTHLALPRRRRVPIHYELDRPPWIASRMQDFFGLARAPAVADGKVPLVLHLLAPNQRPVQVTQDLPGFWVKHYPAIRRELMRKYPRHQWPEDPTQMIEGDD